MKPPSVKNVLKSTMNFEIPVKPSLLPNLKEASISAKWVVQFQATEWSFFCLSAKNWDNTSSFNKCSIQKNKKKKFKMKLFFSLPLEKYLFFV